MSENNNSTHEPTETYLEKLNREYAMIVPGDITKGPRYIVDHPDEFGISWVFGPIQGRLQKKGDLILLSKTAPRIRIEPEQILLFVKTFGPAILSKAASGTSVDVECERVVRDSLIANRGLSNDTLQLKCVEVCLLGITTRTISVVTKFADSAGTPFASQAEAAASSARLARIAMLQEAISSIDAKAAFMVTCSENQWPMDEARMYLEIMTVDQATKLMTTKYGIPMPSAEDLIADELDEDSEQDEINSEKELGMMAEDEDEEQEEVSQQ